MSLNEETELKLKETYKLGTKAYNIAEEIIRVDGFLSSKDKEHLARKHNSEKSYVYNILSKLRKKGLIDGDTDEESDLTETSQSTNEPLEEIARETLGKKHMSYENLQAFRDSLIDRGIPAEAIQLPNTPQQTQGQEQADFPGQELEPIYEGTPPDEITLEDASLKTMPAKVQAKHLIYYDMSRQGAFTGALDRFDGNWSDFINICLDDYFSRVHNVGVGLLARRFA